MQSPEIKSVATESSSAPKLEATFIRRGTINRRHRHIQQAQVHAKLGAMMNQVIHYKTTHHRSARQRKDLVAGMKQRPLALPVFVACLLKRGTRRCDVLIK